ncbi:MAG: aminopeptidase [Erysipelotrichaceae bacterium]|nr:aminopeptidase [Erysipelotrichaceae bacterium]
MVSEKLYEKMAELVVKKGVNVQKDQPVIINANVHDLEFVKKVVRYAYEAGAKYVTVNWRDTDLDKMAYQYMSKETLSVIPQWRYDKVKYEHDNEACYISIASDKPGAMKDVDSDKINAANVAYYTKMADLISYTANNEGQWCVIGLPSLEWAKVVFPELSDEEAFDKLVEAIFTVTRVTEDNDPIAEWEKHDKEMSEHAAKLNDYDFKELHFTSELGTDLTVGLVNDHIWVGGGCTTPKGIFFDPNMPTEECFCMPLKTGTNGIVHASKPLSYNGKVIEDFWFRFENGKVVDFDAKKEKESLKQLLEFDEGASYLGEVALVPYDSPISRSGILFFNTLYDENAACHLALGRPYPENIKGGVDMNKEELKAHGANDSMQHEDFMFGTREMNIDGIQKDGTVVPVFRNGNFVF